MSADRPRWPRGPRPARPDRANWHAEAHHLDALWYVHALPAVVGVEALEGAREAIRDAREAIGSRTSIAACERLLALLATLHRSGDRGFRGLNCTAEQLASGLSRLTGQPTSLSTARNCVRILEAAEFIDRGLVKRGNPIVLEDGRQVARMILSITLRAEAVDLWAAPAGGNVAKFNTQGTEKVAPSGQTHPHARERDRSGAPKATKKRSADSGLARARHRHDDLRTGILPRSALSPPGPHTSSPDEGGQWPPGAANEGGRRRSVARVIRCRPRPDEPRTRQNGLRALEYDIETELWRRGASRQTVETVVRRVYQEARPDWAGRASQDWDAWIWPWREMGAEERRRIVSRCILPAVCASLRRKEVYELPEEPSYVPITASADESGQLRADATAILRLCASSRREPGPRAPTQSRASAQIQQRPAPTGALDPFFADFAKRMGVKI